MEEENGERDLSSSVICEEQKADEGCNVESPTGQGNCGGGVEGGKGVLV